MSVSTETEIIIRAERPIDEMLRLLQEWLEEQDYAVICYIEEPEDEEDGDVSWIQIDIADHLQLCIEPYRGGWLVNSNPYENIFTRDNALQHLKLLISAYMGVPQYDPDSVS